MRMNFFAKLVVMVLVLTLGATGITGLVLLNGMETTLKSNINHEMQAQVGSLSAQVDAMIQEKVKIGQMIARHGHVTGGDAAGALEMVRAVERVDAESYQAVNIVDRAGKVIIFAPEASAANMVGTSIADRQYFKDAKQSGKTVISDVLIAKDTKKPVIIIATPIKDNAGNFAGTVCQVIRLDALEKLRAQVKIGETGYASINSNYNGKSVIIAHPDSTLVAEQKDVSDSPIVKATQDGQGHLMNFKNLNGNDMISVTELVPTTNWIVVAMVPEKEVYAEVTYNRYKMLVIMVVMMLIVIGITWYFARKLAGRLTFMVQRVAQVADGDLRVSEAGSSSDDEIGQLGVAIESMTNSLRGVIGHVTNSAEQVAASSEQLTTGAEQSAQGAEQVANSIMQVGAGTEKQTGAISKTVAVVERISTEIKQAVANVNVVETTSDKAAGAAKDGGKAVEAAVNQMGNIESKVVHSAQVIGKLGERSKEIGQIVDTISGIAGQTNLLSLNAAIEAARAGEQGRGFSVVAEEVRRLAEQSQEAAKQISGLITEIQVETENAVLAMNEGTHEVRIGSDVVNSAGQAFAEIVTLVDQVSEQVKSIATVIQGIAGDSQEIVTAVKEIDEINKETAGQTQTVSAVTEEQSASMEEIAASSEALAKLAQVLQTAVQRFKI